MNSYLHFSQKCVNIGEGGVEDIGGQIVPDLETAEDVGAAVPHPRRDARPSHAHWTWPLDLGCEEAVQLVQQWVNLHDYLQVDTISSNCFIYHLSSLMLSISISTK